MKYVVRPLGPWTGPVTAERQAAHRFRAALPDTMNLLGRETDALGAHLVVLHLDIADVDIRRDGTPRTNARFGFPGARVAFDSRHGPLTYATDTFTTWQANVRAIALALHALRAVDRYGVTRHGEQYRGWAAIDPPPTSAPMTADSAARLLSLHGQEPAEAILTDPATRARAYRSAARRHHPDFGGDRGMFERVTAARDLLNAGVPA